MLKPTSRDLRFVFNACIIALVVMAVLHAINPALQKPPPSNADVMALAATLELLDEKQVINLVRKAKGKPTALVVYASWCVACRSVMPELVTFHQKNPGWRFIFLSQDKSLTALATYLLRANYNGAFTPYVIKQENLGLLPAALAETGAAFQGAIPYVAVYGEKGEFKSAHTGAFDIKLLNYK